MKKAFAFALALIVLLLGVSPQAVYAAETTDAYYQGLDYLIDNGFDSRMISMMSKSEICEYAYAVSSQSDELFFKYTQDSETDTTSIEVYSNEQYISADNSQQVRASNTKTYSWMKLTITSTYLGGDNYIIKCSYDWLKDPFMRWEDIVALTFDTRIVSQKGTGVAKMSYKNSSDLPVTVDYSSRVRYSSSGVYVEFDIPGWGNNDIYGYMSTKAKINNISGGTMSFNNWAYYAHMTSLLSTDYSVSFPASVDFAISPSSSFDVANVGLLSQYTP